MLPINGAQHFQAFCQCLFPLPFVRCANVACRRGHSTVTSVKGGPDLPKETHGGDSSFLGQNKSAIC